MDDRQDEAANQLAIARSVMKHRAEALRQLAGTHSQKTELADAIMREDAAILSRLAKS